MRFSCCYLEEYRPRLKAGPMMTLVVEQDFAALVRTDNAYKHHESAYNVELLRLKFPNLYDS